MKKHTIVMLLLSAALCLLSACKKEETALTVYALGETDEDNVVALDTILGEDEAILASIDEPTDVAVTEGLDDLYHTYHYRKMADPAAVAGRYVSLLLSEEQGFTAIDMENHKLVDPPVTDTLLGTVAMGKKAADNEEAGRRIVRVLVGWSEYSVAVQVAYISGSILPPVVEEEAGDGDGESSTPQATGVKDQAEYVYSLDPKQLGLEGDNMRDYYVYPQQGWVMVNDVECREIMVYRMNPQTAINEVVGTFYLSSDLTQMFKKDGDGQITLIQTGSVD